MAPAGDLPASRRGLRAPRERTGSDEDEHREAVVAHDEPRLEPVLDRQPAEHRLSHDPEREHGAEHRRSRRNGRRRQREQSGADRGDRDDARERAVAELDDRVRL